MARWVIYSAAAKDTGSLLFDTVMLRYRCDSQMMENAGEGTGDGNGPSETDPG